MTGPVCGDSADAQRMVQEQLRRRDIVDPNVLRAMSLVPRHWFVRPDLQHKAYEDRALPTREGQTISQPYIAAKMSELLGVRPGQRVLEVGGGSGYQAAVLATMGAQVISLELREDLAAAARRVLQRLELATRVQVIVADGSLGWPDEAPYDRVIVTAGAPKLPEALRRQTGDGGRIVIPVGDQKMQYLIVFDRRGEQWSQRRDIGCRFVPLVGADGWAE